MKTILLVLVFSATLIESWTSPSAADVRVRIPVSYRSWQASDSSVTTTSSQWVAPVIVSASLSSTVDLLLQGAVQTGTVNALASSQLSGATDTRVAVSLHLARDRLLIQTGLNIPTGPRELGEEEQAVALALAPPQLGYRVRQVGNGLNAGGGVSYAVPLSQGWALGLGGGYLYRGSYRAVKGGADVRPGAEISGSAGIDGEIGSLKVRMDGTRRSYSQDEGGGSKYKEPAVWEGLLAVGAEGSVWGFSSSLLLSRKEEADVDVSPFSGTYFGGSLTLRRMIGAASWLGVSGEAVHFKSPQTAGRTFTSTTGGVGPVLTFPLGGTVRLEGRFLRLLGSLDQGGGSSESIDGWDAQVALSLEGESSHR